MARKDLLARLADAGEDAITRLGDRPGADRLLGVATSMRDRMDEMQKRLRGLDELEKRVAALERKLAAAEGSKRTAARKSASRSTAKKAAAPKSSTTGGASKKPAS